MKVIDPNKALSVALGTAGLFWATNKKLPDWLVLTSLFATTVVLARDVSQLIVEDEKLELEQQNMGGCGCQNCLNKNLQFNPFNIQF